MKTTLRLLSAGLLTLLLAGSPKPVDTHAFMYDEVRIWIELNPGSRFIDSRPGTFERDYDWAMDQNGDDDHKYATVWHVAYWNGWSRVETAQTIQLANLAQHRIIYIDKQYHSFRIYQGAEADRLFLPTARSIYGTLVSAQLGHGTGSDVFTEQRSWRHLRGRSIEGLPTIGRSTMQIGRTTKATGACDAGILQGASRDIDVTTTVEYRLHIDAPAFPAFHLQKFHNTSTTGCVTTRLIPPPSPAERQYSERFLIYQRVVSADQQPGSHDGTKFIDILERGHIRALPADTAPLFAIPAGYRDEDKP